jgi:hypothetical protein
MTPEEQAAQEAEAQAQAAQAAADAEKAKARPARDPAVLEAELERARKEAAKYRTQAREAAEKEKKAEEARLAEKGQFKELAEQRTKELEAMKQELEPLREFKSAADRAQQEQLALRASQVDADFASLPEAVRQHIPADADLRTKEIAVLTYRAGTGAKVVTPPTPTAPRPASGPTNEPPRPTDDEVMALGDPRTSPKEKAEISKKVAAWNAWERSR